MQVQEGVSLPKSNYHGGCQIHSEERENKPLNLKNAVGLAAIVRKQKRQRHVVNGHTCRGLTVRLPVMRVAVESQDRAVPINHL